MNTRVFTQHAMWFGGEEVEFHPWGPKIKLHHCNIDLPT